MQGSATTSLSASNLACRRGDRLLFNALSFNLAAGEGLHITGENGSGKTTLIRALAGLFSPFEGEVRHHGNVGLLDERSALDPDLPLGKALAFWERIDGCSSPNAAHMVLGLEPLLDVPVRYLSTGQKKRASLAVLLNRGVPIWLLDEPLSGLDSAAIAQVTALIRLHLGGGGIALIASHQPINITPVATLAIEDHCPRKQGDEEEL